MEILRSTKCRTFRVASAACRESAIPAIWVSRISTGRPLFCRTAARDAAAIAAALSKSNTRFSKSSFSRLSNADSRTCRRRPGGNNAKPKCASNNVMLVIQTDSAGCRSSHSITTASGVARINALSTLVSRIITYRTSLIGEPDRAVLAAPRSAPLLQNVPQFVSPAWLRVDRVPLPRRARCAELLLPCYGRDAWRAASGALSLLLQDGARQTGPLAIPPMMSDIMISIRPQDGSGSFLLITLECVSLTSAFVALLPARPRSGLVHFGPLF